MPLTTKQKIITTFIIIGLICAIIFLYFHFKSNKNPLKPSDQSQTSKDIINQASKNHLPSSYKGMYLYSSKNDTLYLLATDQKFYDAGKLSNCLNITSQNISSYEISDITKLYNCSQNIPDKYKDKCVGSNGWISVVLQSADDFENYIKKNISGTITPDVNMCYQKVDISGKGDSTFLGKIYHSLEEFLIDNRDSIIMLASMKAATSENAIISAVGETMSHYFLIVMTIQGFMSNNKWTREQTGLMTAQMVVQSMIPKLSKILTEYLEKDAANVIEATGGNIMKVSGEIAIRGVNTLLRSVSELSVEILGGVGQIIGIVGYIQILGMVLDMIDPCNLNNVGNNLTQEFMDSIQRSSDISVNVNSGGLLNTPWDPLKNYCDFDLIDPTTCENRYNECPLSSDDKSKTVDQYCGGVKDKLKKYQNEYLDNLTVNSIGQCIKKDFTNQDLAELFKKCVGGNINWDVISKVDSKNYPTALLPTNKTLQILDVYFINHNTVVQLYLNKYWYLVAGFFGILGITLFNV